MSSPSQRLSPPTPPTSSTPSDSTLRPNANQLGRHEVIACDEKGGYSATSYLASKVTTQPPELKSGNVGQQFYYTAAGAIRDFTPITDGEVSIYYCGATVQ